jgi:hypothetical protein
MAPHSKRLDKQAIQRQIWAGGSTAPSSGFIDEKES